jgi:hypothetical protein
MSMGNKELVTLASLISAGLIKSDDYIPCCDEIILREDSPSELIMDLSLLKDEDAAVNRILSEAYSNFEENYPLPETGYFEVCAKFLMYQSGNITWEEYLRSAIDIAEHGSCQWGANEFNRFLEAYLDSGSSEVLAQNQSEYLAEVLKEEIDEIGFYQNMIEKRNLTSLSKGRS